ncbi:MAG: hypothetical protein WD407_05030 [Rhodospirillales bacterium]
MTSDVGICNSALIKIGAKTITSLTEGSKNANACNEQFGKLRDDLLRSHHWNFATKRVQLARLTETPDFGFDYAYALPSDWLRTVSVHDNDTGAGTVVYRIEGARLHTDADRVYLRYIARILDPNRMPSDFQEALAALLAWEMAIPIAQSNTLSELMRQRFERTARRARSVDAIEDVPERFPDGSWVSEREA